MDVRTGYCCSKCHWRHTTGKKAGKAHEKSCRNQDAPPGALRAKATPPLKLWDTDAVSVLADVNDGDELPECEVPFCVVSLDTYIYIYIYVHVYVQYMRVVESVSLSLSVSLCLSLSLSISLCLSLSLSLSLWVYIYMYIHPKHASATGTKLILCLYSHQASLFLHRQRVPHWEGEGPCDAIPCDQYIVSLSMSQSNCNAISSNIKLYHTI